MWKWDESAACGQARLWRPNGPQCAKTHAVWQSPSSRTEELQTFSIYIYIYIYILKIMIVSINYKIKHSKDL